MYKYIQDNRKNIIKIVIYQLIFIILHYLYDFLPVIPIELISGINESNFQHWKIGFYAYLILVVIEYLLYKNDIADLESFIFSRLLTAWLVSWFIFTYWYIAPALFGKFSNNALEIVWANLALLFTSISFCIIDTRLENLTYDKAFKILIIILTIITIVLFTIFTYSIPWTDVFADPTLEIILYDLL